MLYFQKMGNFLKGLTHDFGRKFQLSLCFVFIKNRPINDALEFGQKFELSSLFVSIENRPRNDI